MKNVGHIAAKNALVLGIAAIVYYLIGSGWRSATAATGSSAAPGSWPSVDELLAIGQEAVLVVRSIPGGARLLFRGAFAAVSLAIVWGAMAERTGSGCTSCSGRPSRCIYSVVSHWIGAADGWLFCEGHAGLRRLDGRPLPGALAGLAGALLLGRGSASSSRQAAGRSRAQHGLHDRSA
jgi:ammonia channel protein AmtB